jgi:hypothetical protein
MYFATMMVKLFSNQSMPRGVYFKYARKYYRVIGIEDDRVKYRADDGDSGSLTSGTFDYVVRSVTTEGSRFLPSKRRVVIDIGGNS